MVNLAEFVPQGRINSNQKKVTTQGELGEAQERAAWAVCVTFFTYQPACARMGASAPAGGAQSDCKLEKMLAFFRNK